MVIPAGIEKASKHRGKFTRAQKLPLLLSVIQIQSARTLFYLAFSILVGNCSRHNNPAFLLNTWLRK